MAELVGGEKDRGAVDLPRGRRLRRCWTQVCLGPKRPPSAPDALEIAGPGSREWGDYRVALTAEPPGGGFDSLPVRAENLPVYLTRRFSPRQIPAVINI